MKTMLLMLFVLMFSSAMFAQPGPRSISKGPTMTIKIYLSNEKLNPNIDDCNKVFPVDRVIPKTTATAMAAMKELFKGATKDEEAKGYSGMPTAETEGILKSINVKNGAAYVNFTDRLLTQMGTATTSCGSGQYFGAIESTLKQFATIKKVFYAVNGNTNEFYEWAQVGECPHGKHCSKANFK